MATYERLIKLYRHSNSITPFEDFTTEIIAGILETHPEILESFIDKILHISGSDYYISTQRTYSLKKDSSVRIDLVLENETTICFVENKVESSEGYNQLDNYSVVLDEFKNSKQTFLRYCTKYFDPKDENRHQFEQFRWSDIAKFLFEYNEKPQINDFYNFLKKHNMANSIEITAKEIFLFENLKQTMNVLDEFLDRLKPAFTTIFGKNSNPDNSIQMRKHGRYVFYKANVFGEGAWNEIGVGFHLEDKPTASIWIWTAKNNNKTEKFNELIKKNSLIFSSTNIDYCNFSQDLSSFLAADNPIAELEKWFHERFNILRKFINETPELEWKVKKPSP